MTREEQQQILNTRDRAAYERRRAIEQVRRMKQILIDDPGNERAAELLDGCLVSVVEMTWLQAAYNAKLGLPNEIPADVERLSKAVRKPAAKRPRKRLYKSATPQWMRSMGVSL